MRLFNHTILILVLINTRFSISKCIAQDEVTHKAHFEIETNVSKLDSLCIRNISYKDVIDSGMSYTSEDSPTTKGSVLKIIYGDIVEYSLKNSGRKTFHFTMKVGMNGEPNYQVLQGSYKKSSCGCKILSLKYLYSEL